MNCKILIKKKEEEKIHPEQIVTILGHSISSATFRASRKLQDLQKIKALFGIVGLIVSSFSDGLTGTGVSGLSVC